MSSENAAEKPRKPPSQKPKKPSAPPSSIPKTPSIPPRSRANTEQSTGSFPPLRASASTPEPQNMSKGRKQAPSAPLPVSGLLGDGSGGGEKSLKMSMGGLEDATRKKKKKRNLDGCHDDTEAAGSLNVYLRRGSKNFDYGRSNEPLTLGRAFGPALVGSLREDPNSDSLQLFSMTLEVIKVVVHLSRSFSSYLREVEGEQADREKQKQMIPDAIKQIPEKLELMAKYINLIVNSLGFGVMITLASKDFESAVRESHTQCILDYEKQTPLDANGKGHLAELWGNVTLTSAALLVVLKERKFSLTEKGDEEEGGGSKGPSSSPGEKKKKEKTVKPKKKKAEKHLKGHSSSPVLKKNFEISSPEFKTTTAVSLDQAPVRATGINTQADHPVTGIPPKPTPKLFLQLEGVVNVLLAPPPTIEQADLVAKNLEKHWGHLVRSVVSVMPDDSFFIDHAKTYSVAFVNCAKEFCLLPDSAEKKQNALDASERFLVELRALKIACCHPKSALSPNSPKEEEEKEGSPKCVYSPVTEPSKDETPLERTAREEREGLVGKIQSRNKAIAEILQTEKSYSDQLTELETLFMDPIKASWDSARPIVTKKDFEAMFSAVGIIFKIVKDHLPEMQDAASPTSEKQIGAVFLKLCPWLKHYAVYINGFDESSRLIQMMRKQHPSFNKLIKEATKKSTQNYDLSSYLILPVQRLGRYELLLKRVIECTPQSHPDAHNLESAVQKVGEVNRQINSFIKADENRLKIIEIVKRFVVPPKPALDTDGRLLVREGEVVWVNRGEKVNSKTKPSYVVLFDDAVLVCKITKDLRLEKRMMVVLTENSHVLEIPDGGQEKKDLSLLLDSGNGLVYVLVFEKKLEKKQWKQKLESAVSLRKELDS